VLIVDDEAGIRAALAQLLEYEGYEARSVASGQEALAQYEAWRPQLVFLDVKMAGIDGLETLKRLRALDPTVVGARKASCRTRWRSRCRTRRRSGSRWAICR
jgi:two-component system nitrogen regulation response regulator NtrX